MLSTFLMFLKHHIINFTLKRICGLINFIECWVRSPVALSDVGETLIVLLFVNYVLTFTYCLKCILNIRFLKII